MNWLNYHHLYYFWTVAQLQSYTKASEQLRISQSAVSTQVLQLEDFFGKKLLLRSTSKKISLTEEGQLVFFKLKKFFAKAKSLLMESKTMQCS